MLDTAFFSPVTILVGMGFPVKVRNILDAIRYLDELPALSRDEAFHAAYGACRDALTGTGSVDDARDVFCALMRRRGVLLEDSLIEPAPTDAGVSLNA